MKKLFIHDLKIFVLAIFFFVFFKYLPAYALSYRYDFTGTITTVDVMQPLPEHLPEISAGDLFTGSLVYRFDPSLEDMDSDPSRGYYPTSHSYVLNFNGFTVESNAIYVPTAIVNGAGGDSFGIYDFSPVMSPVGDYYSTDLDLSFGDSTGTAFSDDSLPAMIDATLFDGGSLFFAIEDSHGIGINWVYGSIGSITQYPVPEPSTLLLSSLGLVGMGACFRKRFNTVFHGTKSKAL